MLIGEMKNLKILLNQNVKSLNFNNDKLENIKLSKDIVIKSDFYIFIKMYIL